MGGKALDRFNFVCYNTTYRKKEVDNAILCRQLHRLQKEGRRHRLQGKVAPGKEVASQPPPSRDSKKLEFAEGRKFFLTSSSRRSGYNENIFLYID